MTTIGEISKAIECIINARINEALHQAAEENENLKGELEVLKEEKEIADDRIDDMLDEIAELREELGRFKAGGR